jgi:hypothetical protein
LIYKHKLLLALITTIFVLGFITNSQLNSFFVVDAQDGSNNDQSENTESVLPDMSRDSSANSTLSNFSLPTVPSSEDGVSDNSNFTQNNTAEQQPITDENATPPEENTTVPQESPITDENATPPEENTTVPQESPITDENATPSEPPTSAAENVTPSEPPTSAAENVTPSEPPISAAENVTTVEPPNNTNNNISASNVTTTSVAPVEGADIINSDSNSSADQALAAEQQSANNITSANITATTTAATAATETNADTLDQTTSPEDTLGAQISNQTESAATAMAGLSTSNSKVENNQITNIQNVINNIAISAAKNGANSQSIAQQISKEVTANPKGQVANSIKQLANEFVRGNPDEVNIAANQIGSLIAKGNNIQQTLIQVTNKVVNNIKNIKATENNFNQVIIRPALTTQQKTEITQTVDVIKKSKQEVDVPRIHIKFDSHERNLVLRILSTNNYRYEMPFSKYNGAFTLDDNQFRVKILSGDGSIKTASVAPMFKSGKVGERNFLDKDVNNGKVFFSLKDIQSGRYLLEVYVKLSNGAIATFARGSVSIR